MKKTVKLGLYGCGNRTKMLLDALAGEDEYEVVSAFDLREESTQTLCKKYGGKACQSADEMLDTKGVEAVMISLDPFAHCAAFLKTLELKKPIYLEKPIAATVQDAHRMTLAAQAAKAQVQVGLLPRYYPAMKSVKQHLAEQDPGIIFSMVQTIQHAGETEIINMHNLAPGNFRLKISQIPFHHCHALDLYHVFIGDVVSVYAHGIKKLKRDYISPDEVIALLEFKNGATGYFHYSGVSYGGVGGGCFINTQNYTIAFDGGGYQVFYRPPHKNMRGELKKEDCRPAWKKHVGPAKHNFEMDSYELATAESMKDFLDSVRTGAPMPVPIEDGYWVAELADAIELSYKQGKKIELPLFGKHKATGKNKQ